jgi:hypothetical protein
VPPKSTDDVSVEYCGVLIRNGDYGATPESGEGRVERGVYLLRGGLDREYTTTGGNNTRNYLRASPHLSPLALKAANPLLSPFSSHLELKLGRADVSDLARESREKRRRGRKEKTRDVGETGR